MLRIGGATAVAEEEQFVTGAQRRSDDLDRFDQRAQIVTQELTLHRNAGGEQAADLLAHATRPYTKRPVRPRQPGATPADRQGARVVSRARPRRPPPVLERPRAPRWRVSARYSAHRRG